MSVWRAALGCTVIAASKAVVSAWIGLPVGEVRLMSPPPSAPPKARTPPPPIPRGKRMPRAMSFFPFLPSDASALAGQYTTIDEPSRFLMFELDDLAFLVHNLAVSILVLLESAISDFRHGSSFQVDVPSRLDQSPTEPPPYRARTWPSQSWPVGMSALHTNHRVESRGSVAGTSACRSCIYTSEDASTR